MSILLVNRCNWVFVFVWDFTVHSSQTEKSFRTGKMKFLLLFLSLASIKYDNVSGATIELFNIEGKFIKALEK